MIACCNNKYPSDKFLSYDCKAANIKPFCDTKTECDELLKEKIDEFKNNPREYLEPEQTKEEDETELIYQVLLFGILPVTILVIVCLSICYCKRNNKACFKD